MTGILDEYPGAAAAYSLRLLNTDYTGDAIVVRRASDNTTQNIGFIDGELDTDALDTFCTGTDGFVSLWYDQSGNGYNAPNAAASEQPKIFDSVTGVLTHNGKPSIYFDGTNDFLQYAGLSLSAAYTMIANIKYSVANTFSYHLSLDALSLMGTDGTPNFRLFAGNSLINGAANTNDNLLFGVVNGANSLFSVNGSAVTGNAGTATTSGISIGKRYGSLAGYFNGYTNEVIIYPNNQSSNRTGIETNINDFYSIY